MIEKIWKVYVGLIQNKYMGAGDTLAEEQELLKKVICEYYGADVEDFNLFESIYVLESIDRDYDDMMHKRISPRVFSKKIAFGYFNVKGAFDVKLEMEKSNGNSRR